MVIFMAAKQHDKYPDRLPVITGYAGGDVKLFEADLLEIENLLADGKTLGYAAVVLGVSERCFKSACKVNTRLQETLKRGRARHKQDYLDDLRSFHKAGKSPIYTVWYGKQALGMTDKTETKHQGGGVVVVNTGIPSPLPATDSRTIIEHDDT
jgi:hypothetical protein